jgi:PadR family transcriptional regulator, regulatory protein PadR
VATQSTVSPLLPSKRIVSRTPTLAIGSRWSTVEAEEAGNVPKKNSEKVELLQGTLDMLVLRALLLGPLHGHAIATHIERTSDDVLRVDHGSLYPALHRLKKRGWITASWERMPDRNRHAKYYRLTASGKKRLVSEHSKWRRLARAIGRIMQPA